LLRLLRRRGRAHEHVTRKRNADNINAPLAMAPDWSAVICYPEMCS